MVHGFTGKVLVVGLGLMGGSFALAAKNRYPGTSIRGVDYPKVLEEALGLGAVEGGSPPGNLEREASRADLVVLATPVSTILSLLERVAGAVPSGCLITDLGSTKVEICEKAREVLPGDRTFIGGHPFCGSQRSGIGHADPALFFGTSFVLTPVDVGSVVPGRLVKFIEGIGARVVLMSPQEHDHHAAWMSHLPRMIAASLCKGMVRRGTRRGPLGGGFRDLTRIASSDPGIWRDIVATNRRPILDAVDDLVRELQALREELNDSGRDGLHSFFSEAVRIHRALVQDGIGGSFDKGV